MERLISLLKYDWYGLIFYVRNFIGVELMERPPYFSGARMLKKWKKPPDRWVVKKINTDASYFKCS